jgi:hypothetical protein
MVNWILGFEKYFMIKSLPISMGDFEDKMFNYSIVNQMVSN